MLVSLLWALYRLCVLETLCTCPLFLCHIKFPVHGFQRPSHPLSIWDHILCFSQMDGVPGLGQMKKQRKDEAVTEETWDRLD